MGLALIGLGDDLRGLAVPGGAGWSAAGLGLLRSRADDADAAGECWWPAYHSWRSLFGGPVALRRRGWAVGVPGRADARGRDAGQRSGLEVSSSPPCRWVDVAGPPALVPFLLGFLGRRAGRCLAVRTRSAGGPAAARCWRCSRCVLLLRRRRAPAYARLVPAWPSPGVAIGLGGGPRPPGARRGRGQSAGGAGAAWLAPPWPALVVGAVLLVAVPLTFRSRPPERPSSEGAALREQRCAAWRTSRALDSPLRRFRTFTEQRQRRPGRTCTRSVLFTVRGCTGRQSGADARPSTGTTVREWLPRQRHRWPALTDDAFLRMDTGWTTRPGVDAVRAAGRRCQGLPRAPGCRRWDR